MDVIRQACALALVFGLLWWAVTWLKTRGYARVGSSRRYFDANKDLHIIDRLALTPQHSLHLVRLKQHVLLVGVHPQGMTLLSDNSNLTNVAGNDREAIAK